MSESRPTVSVILPTYNRADLLDRAITSVLDQTYSDFELLVVDDGSTDATKDVVTAFEDPRVRYIMHDENQGASAARNTGIDRGRGEFFAFQASDDQWHERKLARQQAAFRDAPSDVGVVYTASWMVGETQRTRIPAASMESNEGDILESLFRFNFIPTESAVVRRECFEAVGRFDEQLPRLQDWELWLRVATQYRFKYIDEPLVTLYVQSDSISRDPERLANARAHIVQKHYDLFDTNTLAVQLFRTGHASLKAGKGRTGRRYLIDALRTDPRPLYVGALGMACFGSAVYSRLYRLFSSLREEQIGTSSA